MQGAQYLGVYAGSFEIYTEGVRVHRGEDGEGSVYYAPDIERVVELSKQRRIYKRKTARIAEDEAAIAEEEKRKGVSLSMRQREAFVKERFNRKYNPVLA